MPLPKGSLWDKTPRHEIVQKTYISFLSDVLLKTNKNIIFILEITKDISIEELVESFPGAVSYLMRRGIKCIACGDPIWGTLEEAAREKGFSDEEIEGFVKELRESQRNYE